MACAGVPDTVEEAGDKEIAFYSVAARYQASGVVLGTANCTVSIEFEAGRVSAVNYTVDDPGVLARWNHVRKSFLHVCDNMRRYRTPLFVSGEGS